MVDRILFAGGDRSSVICFNGFNEVQWGTNGAGIRGRNGTADFIYIDEDGNPDAAVGGETLWIHADRASRTQDIDALLLYNTADEVVLKEGQNTWQFWNGTAWVPIFTLPTAYYPTSYDVPFTFDLKLEISANGIGHRATVFIDSQEYQTATFDSARLNNVARMGMRGRNVTNSDFTLANVLVTVGVSTVRAIVETCRATGAGTYSDHAGAYTDVNEQFLNDLTVMTSDAALQRTTLNVRDVTIPAGYRALGVVSWVRALKASEGPQNIRHVVRSNGADAVDAQDHPQISEGFYPLGRIFPTDPTDNAPWDARFNAAQFGFESRA